MVRKKVTKKRISTKNPRPRIDVALIVMHEDRILLGEKRKSKSQGRCWDFPGGAIEYGESPHTTGLRETFEESGIRVRIIDEEPYSVTSDMIKSGRHEITQVYRAIPEPIEKYHPRLREPNKFHQWAYFPLEELPSKLSIGVQNFLKKGYNPFK